MGRLTTVRLCILLAAFIGCQPTDSNPPDRNLPTDRPSLVILGNVQDAGSPHAGCTKNCCKDLFECPNPNRKVVSLGLYDPDEGKTYLFDATPDLPVQMKWLARMSGDTDETVDGIFLTHAHIGHYAGLMYLGRESMNAKGVPVYAMPRMQNFLRGNGPWNQLVALNNIQLLDLKKDSTIRLTDALTVTPLLVPHRDEYSETVGFLIASKQKSALFLPDIDKWEKWERDITALLKSVDYALIDATFYDGNEVGHRDILEIPHPFVIESMDRFEPLTQFDKSKVHFIHLNHTNPLLHPSSPESKKVEEAGYHIGRFLDVITL